MTHFQGESPLLVNNLSKKYGEFEVLKRLNFNLAANSIHGLVGLNGSGKTTTLECILGMQQFDSGEIEVLGHHPSRLYQARGAIVGIFDTPSLHPNLTVRQSLEHGRLLCGTAARSCSEVETLLGITAYSDFKIRHLSLGNKRRASIAHALLGNPELIILDEPFNGLDAEGVDDVLGLIKTLNREQGTAFLLSSHQLPYLEQICSHLAILHKGRIAVSDKIETLFQGNKVRLLVNCDQPKRALELVERSGVARLISTNETELQFELLGATPAELNRVLVNAGIAVSELSPKRESLTSLFYEITAVDSDHE